MLIEFFLERSRIELAADGLTYSGRVLDLPTIHVTAATPELCRQKLTAAIEALLSAEAESLDRRNDGKPTETEPLNDAKPKLTLSSLIDANERDLDQSQVGSEFTDIIYEKRGWVAQVTINRPAAYNAYTDKTLREMTAAFRDAAADNGVAVLVLTGAGERAFSAGGDVEQHREDHVGNPQAARKWMDTLFEAHAALRQLGKPSIARINGMVAGGGNDWNLACDLAIAADHAKFVQIETKVGLVSAGSAYWLPIVVGERRAKEIFLTAEPISANKALLWGLVNDVVPHKQLDKTVDALCQKLVDRFPESTRVARGQLGVWKDLALAASTEQVRQVLASYFEGEEAGEGLRALSEKREVDYRSFRANADSVQKHEGIEPEGGATVINFRGRTTGRSCYSCGAQQVPEMFDYCGLCGTKLV